MCGNLYKRRSLQDASSTRSMACGATKQLVLSTWHTHSSAKVATSIAATLSICTNCCCAIAPQATCQHGPNVGASCFKQLTSDYTSSSCGLTHHGDQHVTDFWVVVRCDDGLRMHHQVPDHHLPAIRCCPILRLTAQHHGKQHLWP